MFASPHPDPGAVLGTEDGRVSKTAGPAPMEVTFLHEYKKTEKRQIFFC